MRKDLLALLILIASTATARDKVENWIEVRSPHFVVATTANEKQARRIADQFERMRSLFHALFPKLKIDPSSPIIVIAVKDDKDFRALEPQEYLAKGSLQLGGLFLRAADKNYVLLHLEAQGEHPYSTVYHEYTHLLMSKAEWMPLWLNEGLAEFYQNTDIDETDARLGQPSVEDIRLLRQTNLLPLPTLFAVDYNSPYYHEENKGSIFYAESWALAHYLFVKDADEKTDRLPRYADLLANGTGPLTAAKSAFGDLKKLEIDLNLYVRQAQFRFFKKKVSDETDPTTFTVESLTSPQADAIRADFLAYNHRTPDARALLDHVLHDDANNVAARETLGFLEFQAGHLQEAKKWYRQAVELDSQSYLAHYYFAAISMQGTVDPSDEKQIENSLRMAIKLNPSFAPPFDRLAVFLGSRGGDLSEAHMMGLTAVSLDPENMGYRVNVASVLMRMGQGQNAVNVLRIAAKLAKTPQESQFVNEALLNAQTFATAQDEMKEPQEEMREQMANSEASSNATVTSPDTTRAPRLVRRESAPTGPHHFVTGVLKDVHCDSLTIDLAVKSAAKSMNLHADNYFKIQFTTLGFPPTGDLNPCDQLEGRPAKVEYIETADKSKAAYLFAVELHK
jgi:tetratricopeptide (TPR) repeat protein